MANAGAKRDESRAGAPAVVARIRGQVERAHTATATLAIVLGDGETPPTEFRLFVAGWNDTENGRFLFDDQAAKATMAAYAKWGVDLAIDLEHQMLEPQIAPDPTAKDARGWCNLELRTDGSLWAINVTWTPDGVARLTEKRQRYVSPAFSYDTETGRITSIINVAITAIPATHDTPALVAARKGIAKMAASGDLSPKLVSAALDAVASKDAKGGLVVLQQIIAALLGGSDPDAATEDAPPPAGDGGADETTEAPAAAAADPAKKDDMAAAARVAIALTGKTDPGEAMAELARRSKVAVDLEAREAKLSADRKTLEMGTRRANAIKFTQLGAETPHTTGLAEGTLCKRLAEEPFEEQNARLAALLAARGGKLPAAPIPPNAPTPSAGPANAGLGADGDAVDAFGNTARDLQFCKELKCDPQVYATLKARRDAAAPAKR